MTEKQRKTTAIITFILIFLILFLTGFILNKEWDMIRMKKGDDAPIIWEDTYPTDNVLLLEMEDKHFERIDVRMTDIYYLPNKERLHFGIWYDLSDYISEEYAHSVFTVKLEDEDGNVYDENRYSKKRHGIFGKFQYRQISGVSLDGVKELYMSIYPVEYVRGQALEMEPETKLIFTEALAPLPEYDHHLYNND
ncbi:hypothetical protein [Ornithinibacillus halophilus]|uniref:Uncharacterized protein n=1 Tax=Ornithinibacillus halophilus TaxID=930117 RepID=A0A1M5JXP4_9BACI|nr:hypothetical protein [Ornithinibacillus halophilus]SHG45145.1 hypothetical protein SAMN05216225_103410 [Ornithinibacillus halophilus]